MLDQQSLALYLCADSTFFAGRKLERILEEAIEGGVGIVQLREKTASSREFYEIARAALAITKARGVPLVVNDRLDIALAAGVDGVHVGQTDLPLSAVKRIAGSKLFVGVSAGTVTDAIAAENDGADYIGAGAVFPTTSKDDAGKAIGVERLAEICAAVRIPVVAIGGISLDNAASVMQAGVAGVAVISAILSQPDIFTAARNLKARIGR
ncbi:MAG: thiamine phosphate synthase [Treponema sp.]|nr:thiamine phosphate synthase [Treponema sp.]